MSIRAVLFDLDDTLVQDSEATQDAVVATAARAESRGVEAATLARALWRRANGGWLHAPFVGYFEDIGISPGECLWGRFTGEDPRLRPIRTWAPGYQLDCWSGALGEQGVRDEILAATLAERFRIERRARHNWLYADARETLDALAARYQLALVTNGASDIQRDKLAGSDLEGYFSVTQVSGEVGAGKPDPAIFRRALEALGMGPGEAVMVGDNAARDALGANRAGIAAIWLRRGDASAPPEARLAATITSLAEVPGLLETL